MTKQGWEKCKHEDAVMWNEFNKVVQCHRCGEQFIPILELSTFAEEVEKIMPKVVSEKSTEKEIRKFPKRLDTNSKQNIRAKNHGWNLCVTKTSQALTNLKKRRGI